MWDSPISARDVSGSHAAIMWVGQVGNEVWWVQSQPELAGRYGLYRAVGDGAERVTDDKTNVRSRVHEYGGQPWAALAGDRFCFVEWSDQRVYVQSVRGAPRPISPVPPRPTGFRYADPVVVGDEIWLLREEFFGDLPTNVTRDFVALPLNASAADDPHCVRVLGAGENFGGHHFLAGLRVSPDGTKAVWIGWNHPYMSWDRSEVVVADIVDGRLANTRVVAGGAPTPETVGDGISICQVEWETDDTLLYLSDIAGWWNLYRHPLDGVVAAIQPVDRELGGPLWRVGQKWFGIVSPGLFAVLDHGRLCLLDEVADTLLPVTAADDTGLSSWGSSITVSAGRVAGFAYGPKRLPTVATLFNGAVEALGGSAPLPMLDAAAIDLAEDWLPTAECVWFDSDDGARVPAHVYRPTNPGHADVGAAPYIVHIHGGPTGENGTGLDLEIAYFTSRGFGVVAPEYGGSTGSGRLWRERLNGQWGVVDLADAVAVANGLVQQGLADPRRLGIRGGSAGGFTTALALTSPSPFSAGCARYPLVDLLAFAGGETHDLESQYLSGIVGPLPGREDLYLERSPLTHAAQLHAPLLVLQGLDDQICQPRATQRFVDAARAAGGTIDYRTYAGEQHGFRAASTVAHAIDVEFAYFADVFGIEGSETCR